MKKYKFAYPLEIRPLSSNPIIDFTVPEVREMIEKAIFEYNISTNQSRSCRKQITNAIIEKKSISLLLLSEAELNSPGRALRTLSLNLVKNRYFKDMLVQKHLFKTYLVDNSEDSLEALEVLIDVSDVTNYELLHAVIDAIERGSTDISAVSALEAMKKVALEAGLIRRG